MIFESNNTRVIFPLDPSEGARYTELDKEEYNAVEIDNIYQVTTKEEEQINPTADGKFNWQHDTSFASDSKEELENLK